MTLGPGREWVSDEGGSCLFLYLLACLRTVTLPRYELSLLCSYLMHLGRTPELPTHPFAPFRPFVKYSCDAMNMDTLDLNQAGNARI